MITWTQYKRLFFLFLIFFLTIRPIQAFAYCHYGEGHIVVGEDVFDAFYCEDNTYLFPICDPTYVSSEDDCWGFTGFYMNNDDFNCASFPVTKYVSIDHVTDYSFQWNADRIPVISIRGYDHNSSAYYSLQLDIKNRKLIKYKKSTSKKPVSFALENATTALNATQVKQIILQELDFDDGDYWEGGISLYFSPTYGYLYLIGGGFYQYATAIQTEDGYSYDEKRVDLLMNPFSGEILAYSIMPYSLF